MNRAELTLFLNQIQEKLGGEALLLHPIQLEKYQQSTLGLSKSIPAAILPKNTDETQIVVQLAHHYKIPLYPLSRGLNWGYGSRLPVKDQQVILDLSLMKAIRSVNEEFAYAIIEPGVTQQQLYEYLAANAPTLMMDASGAGPHVSLIGNYLERGFGFSPLAERAEGILHIEAVLADGRKIETSPPLFHDAKAKYLYKWGVGPSILSLFGQSNFVIVTAMAIKLMKKPETILTSFFYFKDSVQLTKATDAIRSLQQMGEVTSAVKWSHRDSLALYLVKKDEDFKKTFNPIGYEWVGSFGIYGSNEHVQLTKRKVKQILGKVAKVYFCSSTQLKWINRCSSFLKWIFGQQIEWKIEGLNMAYRRFHGQPEEKALQLAYLESQHPIPEKNLDPDRDGCGLIWFAPVLPLKGEDVFAYANLSKTIIKKYDFRFCPAFTAIGGRTCVGTIPILFNRMDEKAKTRAFECYHDLFEQSVQQGYPPYRISIHAMNKLLTQKDSYHDLLHALKRLFDPDNLIASGRYGL